MIDAKQFLIPLDKKKALLVSDSEWGLEELEGLLTTMGGEAKEKMLVVLRKVDPGTYLGSGKLEEINRIMETGELDLLLVDFDLSPSQLKNIEKKVDKRLVLDRSSIILEIFNRHARTKEAKLQVELARLQYFMPRLMHLWSHFERQRGSGGGALKGKGMGEKQFEVDRRLVKDRVNFIKKKLKEAESSRELHRKSREKMLKVAIVGYTNAGKSTLLNALTNSDVLVEDALFATLDATVRLLNPTSRPAVLGIDTVGFIDRLPHNLVASFRSTLSEVLEADLLVHVLDASNPEVRRHYEVTMSVLKELGADLIPCLLAFNKTDLCGKTGQDLMSLKIWATGLVRGMSLVTSDKAPEPPKPSALINETPLFISAHVQDQVVQLRERIMKYFERGMEVYELMVPFEDGKTSALLHEISRVEVKRPMEKGMFFRVRVLAEFANQYNLEKFRI